MEIKYLLRIPDRWHATLLIGAVHTELRCMRSAKSDRLKECSAGSAHACVLLVLRPHRISGWIFAVVQRNEEDRKRVKMKT